MGRSSSLKSVGLLVALMLAAACSITCSGDDAAAQRLGASRRFAAMEDFEITSD